MRINIYILMGRLVHNTSQWPKPSCIPLSSIVFLFLNLGAVYFLELLNLNILWLTPFFLLNIFFFWAESDIYQREKRNYESWNKEMGYLMGVTDRNGVPLSHSVFPKKQRKNTIRDNGVVSGRQTV